jgi:hypothetical protein
VMEPALIDRHDRILCSEPFDVTDININSNYA